MSTSSVPDKELRQLLRKYAQLTISRTKRHIRIGNPDTGRFIVAPTSGSDWRGLKNLERDIKRRLCADV